MRALMSERVGYELPSDFQSFVLRQARATVRELELDGLLELANALDESPDGSHVWVRFISRMTIGESYLFRNPTHMDLLRHVLLPALIERARRRPVSLWSAGCARGEEPYTLAILLHEIDPSVGDLPLEIIATDIDADALIAARRARYGAWAFRQTPYHIQRKYFTKCDQGLALHPGVARMVHFGYHHVATDRALAEFPADGFDLILCRNVLMYLRQDFRDRAGRRFAGRLHDTGFFIPGQVERLDGVDDRIGRSFVHGSGVYYHASYRKDVDTLFRNWKRGDGNEQLTLALERSADRARRRAQRQTERDVEVAGGPEVPALSSVNDTAPMAAVGTIEPLHLNDAAELPVDDLEILASTLDLESADEQAATEPAASPTPVIDEVTRRLEALQSSELYDEVRALVAAGRVDDAHERCITLIEHDPLEARHHCLLALVQLESDNAAGAISSLRPALYCDPDNITAYYVWWLVGVRYHGAAWERTRWAKRHLLRLTTALPDAHQLPLVGRVTVGDVRYLLQRDWSVF